MLLKQRRPGKVLGECHTQAITAAAAAAFRLVWLRCRRCFYFFAGGQEFFFLAGESCPNETEPRCSQVLPLIKFTLAGGGLTRPLRLAGAAAVGG